MISGYFTDLYANELSHWHTHSFQTSYRKQMATEWIWMNYPPPLQLHDYRYLGNDYRERERLKGITQRWSTRFKSMPTLAHLSILKKTTL